MSGVMLNILFLFDDAFKVKSHEKFLPLTGVPLITNSQPLFSIFPALM
jgi:hypothetical protein